jgi:hypothetical protein
MSVNKLDASEENGGHNRTSQYLRLISNLEMVAAYEFWSKPTKTNFSHVAHDVKNWAMVSTGPCKRIFGRMSSERQITANARATFGESIGR